MKTRSLERICIALVAACGLTACGDAPSAPTATPTASPLPPALPVVTRIGIEGPSTVPLRGTAQFRAIASLSDGSTLDVTNEAAWAVFGPALSTAGPGLVTGSANGEGGVYATLNQLSGSKHVIVSPPGTFRLVVRVLEADASDDGIADAVIEVVSAGVTPMSQVSNLSGNAFYGVNGATAVRVIKNGYQTVTHDTAVTDHQAIDITLPLVAPRLTVSGHFTLTITAASECGIGLGERSVPDEIRTRSYQAEVRQSGARLLLTISNDNVRGPFSQAMFGGMVEPGRVVFDFTWWDGEEPWVREVLPDSRLLVIDGRAVTTGSSDNLAGPLAGRFRLLDQPTVWAAPIAWCASNNHRFQLSR